MSAKPGGFGLSGVSPGGDFKRGLASFYGKGSFTGYCGKRFVSERDLVFAHKTLPCGARVEFRSASGRVVIGRVVDRGPFTGGRDFDLSWALAARLGLIQKGVGNVFYRVD